MELSRIEYTLSLIHIYVQIIDDLSGKTLAAASSLGMTEKVAKKDQAAKDGEIDVYKRQNNGC